MEAKNQNIICIAKLLVKKDNLKEVVEIFSDLMKKSPREEGCMRYELHQTIDNPLEFTFVDRFKDMAAFEFHCEQDYAKKYFDDILPKLTDKIEFTICHEIDLKNEI